MCIQCSKLSFISFETYIIQFKRKRSEQLFLIELKNSYMLTLKKNFNLKNLLFCYDIYMNL